MDAEECDFYKATSIKDKICDSFTGDRNKTNHISNCRYHCSTMEFKKMMDEDHQVLERHHGRLRRK
jgi:hypothetical protein